MVVSVTATKTRRGPKFRDAFVGNRPHAMDRGLIATCRPMYNDEADELLRTLACFSDMARRLPGGGAREPGPGGSERGVVAAGVCAELYFLLAAQEDPDVELRSAVGE